MSLGDIPHQLPEEHKVNEERDRTDMIVVEPGGISARLGRETWAIT
jgi:hypothetical protein